MTTIVKDQKGNVLQTIPGTQPHPDGPAARDPNGVPYNRPKQASGKVDQVKQADEVNPERISEIQKAIGQLDARDESLWTADNAPAIPALQEVLGYKITAKERDAAWQLVMSEEGTEQ